ncbi:MAG: nuclear transport factor 2 family protein [Ferruginibacter sp.]
MKKITFLFFITVLFTNAHAQADQVEIAAVAKTVSYYMDGGTFADSLQFSKAFSPEGQMLYMRNDTLRIMSLKDFMARANNSKKKTERKTKIDNIQVYGNAAQAKLTIEYDTFYFHDMMSLLKTKDGWKIVSKTFYREDKLVNK